METNDLAHEQESSHEVYVDVNASDPDKAVTRVPVQRPPRGERQNQGSDDADERRADRKAFAKRFTKIQRSFDQRLANQQAEFNRQLADRDRKIASLEARRVDGGSGDDAAHEAEINRLTGDLEAALEAGESSKVAKLQAEISRKEAAHWAKKEAKLRGEPAPDTRQQRPTNGGKQPKGDEPDDYMPRKGRTPQANKWLRDNEEWLYDEDFKIEQQAALMIDKDLDEEGYEANSDDYFVELSQRLLAKFPKLGVVSPKAKKPNGKPQVDDDGDDAYDDDEPQQRRRVPPVAMVEDRGESRIKNRRGSTKLTRDQEQTMRAVGLDPSNNKHVLTYLQEAGQIEE